MKFLPCMLALAGFCHGADLNVEAVGRDLNGWRGGVARYSLSGTNFEVIRTNTGTDANGNLIATTVIRERKGNSPVFEGTLRALISPDGLVRILSMEGTVDGQSFKTGQTTRPEPVVVAPETSEDSTTDTIVDVTPVSPEKGMRDSFAQSLRSSIERAKNSDKTVRRDLSSWIFSSQASPAESIADGVDQVVQAIFRHGGR